jgi:hypothetical protein
MWARIQKLRFKMKRLIRVEIVGRSNFWRNAVFVEWEHQYPDRKLKDAADGYHFIEATWIEDLKRVAAQCFSEVLIAPDDPGRRNLFRRFIGK